MSILLFIIGAYIIGSIPTGFLIAKTLKGIDIREHGSGNIGATNAWRTVGKTAGLLTLSLDILKGFIPTIIAKEYFNTNIIYIILTGFSAFVGHTWTIFLNFKGGRGVATGLGVFLVISPIPTIIVSTVALIVALVSGYMSIGSIIASVLFPILTFYYQKNFDIVIIFTIIVSLIILLKHIPNIKRLLTGTEKRFGRKDK